MSESKSNRTSVNKYNNFHFLHKKAPCFEGFYLKTAKKDGTTLVVICGFAKSKEKSHAFIQVSTQSLETFYFEYPLYELKINEEAFNFSIRNNEFSQNGIYIKENDCEVDLTFSDFTFWNRTYLNPSIMGVLAYVPFVECKHDIISPSLTVLGHANLKAETLIFDNTSGYIDKNWGRSFPKDYFWGHISNFENPSVSIQFAKAKPKWLFWKIPVYIGFLRLNHEIHLFKSWKKGKMTLTNVGQDEVLLQNRKFKIKIKFENGRPLNLKAPIEGKLDHLILERAGILTRVTIYKLNSIGDDQILINESVLNSTLEVLRED